MLQPEEWRRSVGHRLENVKQQHNKSSSLLPGSSNHRARWEKSSMFFRCMNNGMACSPVSSRCTQHPTDGLEGQCNWVFGSISLLGNGSMFASVIFVTQKEFPVANTTDISDEKNSTDCVEHRSRRCGRYKMG